MATPPVCRTKGSTYLVTRRCTQRRFLLRPSAFINGVVRFILAYAAERYSIEIHAVCVMSNHFHLVVTDPKGQLSDFMRWTDSVLARILNAHHGRSENFFAPGSFNDPKLLTASDALDKIVYVLTNPVAAGLVSRGSRWPGVRLGPEMVDRAEEVERPAAFFRRNGPVAATAVLRLTKPPMFSNLGDDEYLGCVREAVSVRESEIRTQCAASGRKFLGERRVLAASPHSRPQSVESRQTSKPRIIARDQRIRREAIAARRRFLASYRAALEEFCACMKEHTARAFDVVFPAGTYWMRVRYGVRCADSAAPG